MTKLKEELALKGERIKELEKNEKKLLQEKEKNESMGKIQKELNDRVKSLETEKDMLVQEKNILQTNVKKYDEKLMDLEY